jgi:transcriptional regulator with XRE-family HTH domain
MNNHDLFDDAEVFPDSHPGRILRGQRTREDMTRAELAAKAGLKPHHISEMENAKRTIGKDVARRLAKALNADFRMLLQAALKKQFHIDSQHLGKLFENIRRHGALALLYLRNM